MPVYLTFCLFTYQPACLPVLSYCLSACLSTRQFVHLSLCSPSCLTVRPFACFSVWLLSVYSSSVPQYVCMCSYLTVCLSVSLPVYLFVCLPGCLSTPMSVSLSAFLSARLPACPSASLPGSLTLVADPKRVAGCPVSGGVMVDDTHCGRHGGPGSWPRDWPWPYRKKHRVET